MRFIKLAFVAMILLIGCGQRDDTDALEVVDLGLMSASEFDRFPQRLSDWGFFELPLNQLEPLDRVFPYDMNIPLFTDHALKARFMYIPADSAMVYRENEVMDFPVGSVLIKNFFYLDPDALDGKQIIETRLLVLENAGWVAIPYVWNESQDEAFLTMEGAKMDLIIQEEDRKNISVNYAVPNANQCKSCHMYKGAISPIGPSAKQWNQHHQFGKDSILNQLLSFARMELIRALPAYDQIPYMPHWEDHSEGLLDERARGYLDINCAHCHRPEGPAKTSGLDLRYGQDGYAIGIMKRPVAAGKGTGGRHFDIYPGYPDRSILLYRMESTDPGEMMPELGRSMVHEKGVELIRRWIEQMEESTEL